MQYNRRRQRTFRPAIEALEDRQLLALVINPTFAQDIKSDPKAATIEASINSVIAAFESSFSNAITVNITFEETTTGLSSSSTIFGSATYSAYRAALVSAKTTADDTTALASLPTGTDNPVNNNPNLTLSAPLLRALGLPGGTAASDATIALDTSIMNLSRTGPQNPKDYDLLAATAHEIDEVLGGGSAMDVLANGVAAPAIIEPLDLFRYSAAGVRSFNTTASTKANDAYFSIDGGVTDLANFNQEGDADFGDWFSYYGGQTPQIQDAFGTPGTDPNLGIELRRLDVLGYARVANAALTVTAPPAQLATPGVATAINLGSFTDTDKGPWTVTVSWGDGSANTTFSVAAAGSLGSKTHTYATGTFVPQVTVTDFTGVSGSASFKVATAKPVVAAPANQLETAGVSTALNLGTFTDRGKGPWSVTVSWGDGSANTTFSVTSAGSLGTQNHTFATGAFFPKVTVTDPAGFSGSASFTVADAPTWVGLDTSNNLVIQDVTGKSDALKIQADATNSQYIIADLSGYTFTFAGVVAGATISADKHTVFVPFAAVTGTQIDNNTLGGTDSLAMDLSLGAFPQALNDAGGAGANSFLISGTPTVNPLTWNITGPNAGSIAAGPAVTFSNVRNLSAGLGENIFVFAKGATLGGKINGGADGKNWLDYAAFTKHVIINLATGFDSAVAGGVVNFANVIGSAVGGDTLTGSSAGGVLVGHGSGNIISAGAGRSVIIGGYGINTLTGGASDDLLINGRTNYDGAVATLDAILGIWQGTQTYTQRIAALQAAGADQLKIGTTVFVAPGRTPGGIGPRFGAGNFVYESILFGKGGRDWFITNVVVSVVDRQAGEVVTVS